MEVRKIAKLAYLIVEEKEFEKEFSAILGYVDKLKELDVSRVEETANLSSSKNVFREDVEERKETKDILKLMPETKNNYLEVKEVFFENE
ncbi:MAG: Asp-tRNA(Asn)/Glu-tRNA(Gln) amidotransferase subunit GatC [Candidatus Paceibacterota bacterium]|jgi:aspartyl/glutamyl-tRNA(Asn/Gln) amidotransferase C subunit|nr:Asp-tRNA(Asn)/Glu-tRNA(Gln) amidotransferase subunit GatC [Candidatus Paceibacterota bacterium]MDD5555224.1 Asp-tRNA(Asn)/Glu-tRNA(Gln) amidotransferase subunit GatC [Candidatus Paceibacterota bacterium]